MKWIALRNNGIFELQTALNLIGASVKPTTDPIGMFGSGAKYALAQASRIGMSVKIILGGVIWTMQTKKVIFRETEEEVIQFRSETGKIIKTPVTKKFGEKDWNDSWFIFREFYSNMLDENGAMEIVEGIPFCGNDETVILLQYSPLAKYADNVEEYFKKRESRISLGSGKVFVQGVYTGESELLKKFQLDISFEDRNYDILTETRTIKEYQIEIMFYWILQYKSYFEEFKGNVDILLHIIKHREHLNRHLSTKENYENWMVALSRVDEKYIIVTNETEESDAVYMGRKPIKFLYGFSSNKSVAQYCNLDTNIHTRFPNAREEQSIARSVKKLQCLGNWNGITFKIIKSTTKMGTCQMEEGIIEINEQLFNEGNEFTLLETLIHEYGHFASKALDGERKFVDFFTRQLATLAH